MPGGRGVQPRARGCPPTAYGASDLTTTAPRRGQVDGSRASSAPWPAVPDAVITGLGRATEPTVVVRSTVGVATVQPSTRERRRRAGADGAA